EPISIWRLFSQSTAIAAPALEMGCSRAERRVFDIFKEPSMTGQADFTPQEWELVLEGPPSAGMLVSTAQRGGMFRESFAMAKAYVEAREQHGQNQLLDEIAAAKPELDHTRYSSAEELKQHGLQGLRGAVQLPSPTG